MQWYIKESVVLALKSDFSMIHSVQAFSFLYSGLQFCSFNSIKLHSILHLYKKNPASFSTVFIKKKKRKKKDVKGKQDYKNAIFSASVKLD